MATAVASTAAAPGAEASLPPKDKFIVLMLVFFATIAFTLQAYWLMFHQVMESRTDPVAGILALYWPADYTYRIAGYPIEKSFTLALEGVYTLVIQWMSLLLIWAILKRRPYRYALQLTIATCAFYGTLLYYLVGHISDYAVFAHKGAATYLMFYLANLPWFVGYAWMGWDAYRTIVRRYGLA